MKGKGVIDGRSRFSCHNFYHDRLIAVEGYQTIQRSGRIFLLRWQGGKATDLIKVLRKELRHERKSELLGATVLGVKEHVILYYEVQPRGRLRVDWFFGDEASHRYTRQNIHQAPSGNWVAMYGQTYIGTYETEDAAIAARAAYLSHRKIIPTQEHVPGIRETTGHHWVARRGNLYIGIYPTKAQAIEAKEKSMLVNMS